MTIMNGGYCFLVIGLLCMAFSFCKVAADFHDWLQSASVDDYGAVGNGQSDDTDAFRKALNASLYVFATPGKHYLVSNLDMNSFQTLDGRGAQISPFGKAGTTFVFRMCSLERSTIRNVYFSDSGKVISSDDPASDVETGMVVVDNTRQPLLEDITMDNVEIGVNVNTGSGHNIGTRDGSIRHLRLDGVRNVGLFIGSWVHDMLYEDIQITSQDQGMQAGVRLQSGESDGVKGANRFSQVTVLSGVTSFQFINALEVWLDTCLADSPSHNGFHLDHSERVFFANCWVSVIGNDGFNVVGNSVDIQLTSFYAKECKGNDIYVEDGSHVWVGAYVRDSKWGALKISGDCHWLHGLSG